MRILIMSMPVVAIVTVLVTTAQRIPEREPTLRDTILPETLHLVRSMKGFHNTIANQIDQAEGNTSAATPITALLPTPRASYRTWSAGDGANAD